MFSKRFLLFQIIAILICISLYVGYRLQQPQKKTLPVLGSVAAFTLNNSDGFETSLTDLKGKIWVGNLMFTTCGSICPMMTKNMNILHRSFREYNDVRFVSISVNPENDTPDTLKKYAQKYRIDTNHWFFLTGSREDITKLAVESFKLGDMKEPIFHSSYFVLVDRQGRIRAYYDGIDNNAIKKLAAELTDLLKEK